MKIRNMLLLFLAVIGTSCQDKSPKPDGFEITAEVNGLGDARIIVLKFVNGGLELDSIRAIDNRFEYAGKVKEPYFVQLLIQNGDSTSGKLTEFMLENSQISISGSSTDYDSVQVSGSASDKVLKAYFEEDEILSKRWNQLKEQYDLAVEDGDTIQRKELAGQLNAIFKVDRVELLKKYVADNSNSTIGALIPAFCTIEDALTQEDYLEIYDMLDDKIKVTDYGMNIAERAGQESAEE